MSTFEDYQARTIRLTDERLSHIIDNHDELIGMERALRETLAAPEQVRESTRDEQVRLYYRWYNGTKVGDKYMCVVVVAREDIAFVATAYLTDKVKEGKLL